MLRTRFQVLVQLQPQLTRALVLQGMGEEAQGKECAAPSLHNGRQPRAGRKHQSPIREHVFGRVLPAIHQGPVGTCRGRHLPSIHHREHGY